jgi:hypothetical protein
MAEILQVFTIVRRLLPPDSLPWQLLVLPSSVEKLRNRYKFQVTQIDPTTPNQLTASIGEFVDSGVPRPIQQLVIEPNVIQFQTATDSDKADLFYLDLLRLFEELDPSRTVKIEEYTKTFQTIVVAKLKTPFDRIFSEKMRKFLEHDVGPRVKLPDTEAQLSLQQLSWRIAYSTHSENYLYMPKLLTIEPRQGSKLSDCVYYTMSPSDFKTHLELLEAFERRLA